MNHQEKSTFSCSVDNRPGNTQHYQCLIISSTPEDRGNSGSNHFSVSIPMPQSVGHNVSPYTDDPMGPLAPMSVQTRSVCDQTGSQLHWMPTRKGAERMGSRAGGSFQPGALSQMS